jgi:AcrR family transcriptional regulator
MGSRQAPDRTNQKDRTRKALSDAAAEMIRLGLNPTVAEAAEAAGVHRATAYRYFPTSRALVAEAAMAVADINAEKVYANAPAQDPFTLMDVAVVAVCDLMFAEESLFRHNLAAALDGWFQRKEAGVVDEFPFRSTRRFTWIDPALEPLVGILDEEQMRRLRNALALTFGAEAVVVTRDVCRIGSDEATETMRWAAAALIRTAIEEAGEHTTPHQLDVAESSGPEPR